MDIRQFAYAGIDVYGLLADYLGVSTAEIQEMQSSGKITYDMLSGALQNASKEGGRFAGAMEKQSKTINGMISNFKDNIGNLAGDLSSGFTDALKNILPPINNMIDRIDGLLKTNPRFIEFSQNIATVFKTIGNAIDKLSDDQLNSIIDMFVALAKTGPLLLGLGAVLPKVGKGFSLLGGGVGGAFGSLGSLLGLIPTAGPILSGVVTSLGGVGQAIISLVGVATGITAIVGVLGFVNEQTGGKLQEMANTFMTKGPQIVESFVQSFVSALPRIITQGQNILTSLVTGIQLMLPSLLLAVDSIFQAITSTMIVNGPQIAYTLTDGLLGLIEVILNNMPGFVEGTLKIIIGVLEAMRDNLPKLWVLARQSERDILDVLVSNMPEFVTLGIELINALIQRTSGTNSIYDR